MNSAKEIVQQFYAAVRRRDLVEARRYLDDRLVFVGLFETYANADAYIAALARLLSITTGIEIRVIIGEGDDATIFFDLETKELEAKVPGAPIKTTTLVAEWHRVRNGKIIRSQSAFDGRPFASMSTGVSADPARTNALSAL